MKTLHHGNFSNYSRHHDSDIRMINSTLKPSQYSQQATCYTSFNANNANDTCKFARNKCNFRLAIRAGTKLCSFTTFQSLVKLIKYISTLF